MLKSRLILALLLLPMSGCAVVTAVSAIPGALYGVVSDQFSSEEVSLPYSMRATLAAIQHSLQTMRLDIDMLETQTEGGYGISFTNHKLDGEITLLQQTEQLTTIQVSVKTNTREASIEHAIITLITTTLKEQPSTAKFQIDAYHPLRTKADSSAKQIGWFRTGAMLDAQQSATPGWLKVELPSGDKAFLNGSITVSDKTTH